MSENEPQISRVTRSKEEAKASYDKLSQWYDMLARSERKCGYAGLQKLSARDYCLEDDRLTEVDIIT
jgi:hypothetical protein